MNELRWILLAAGVVLVVGVYVWGMRSSRRAATRDTERTRRVEPPFAARPQPAARVEPAIDSAGEPPTDERPGSGAPGHVGVAPVRPGATVRREPRIEPSVPVREPAAAAQHAGSKAAAGKDERGSAPRAQQIIALRIVAPPPATFAGTALREAIEQEGLAYGRYQIFHRLDAAGEPVLSLASLREPGSFDIAGMESATFRGVAMFTVLPGPLPGVEAFDALLDTARAIAGRLGGLVQDERGVALGPVRIAELRESAATFAPLRATTPDT